MTSLPSSPAPSSMARVAEGESGVPRAEMGCVRGPMQIVLMSEFLIAKNTEKDGARI